MSFFKPRDGHNPWRGPSHSKAIQGPRSQEGSSLQGPIRTPPAPPLGALLERVTPDQFNSDTHDEKENLEITETRFLASYNWTDARAPSIIFPGEFPRSKAFQPSLTIFQRYASTVETSHRSNTAPARFREVLQRPQLRPSPEPSHGTGGQRRSHTASTF